MENLDELRDALSQGIVNVTFTKADGSTRVMLATLNHDIVPAQSLAETTQRKPNTDPLLVKVYDTEAAGWRSFRAERIQNWQKV